MKKYDYLIVGAGLFGAVFAHEATKRGKTCLAIDISANVGAFVDDEHGFARFPRLLCKGRAKQSRTDNKIVIFHSLSIRSNDYSLLLASLRAFLNLELLFKFLKKSTRSLPSPRQK